MERGLDDAGFKASDTSTMTGASPAHTAPSRQIWLWATPFPRKHPGSLSGLKAAALVCLLTPTSATAWAPLVAQLLKNPPKMWEICVRSLEDPLKKGRAMHSSILAWRIPWTI